MSENVDIVINAKNQASATLDAVGNSVGKLLSSFKGVAVAAAPLMVAFAAIKTVTAGFTAVSDSISDFDREAESVEALARAIKFSGVSAEGAVENHQALADALEKQVNIESDVTMGLMRQASMLGVQESQLDAVTKSAIGLSQAMGISLEDGLKKARQATEGHFESFTKMLPKMKELETNEEKLALVMELSTKGLKDKEAASGSALHATERMNIAVGNLMETVGEVLSPLRVMAADGIQYLAESMETFLLPIAKSVADYFASWGPFIAGVFRSLVEAAVSSYTYIEVVINNFGDYTKLVFTRVHLEYVQFIEDTKHTFMVTIPQIFNWFVDNAFELLTKGFEAKMISFPELIQRQITGKEQDLQATIGKLGTNLGNEFNKKYSERMAMFGSKTKEDLNKDIGLIMDSEPDEKKKKDKAGVHSKEIDQTVQVTQSRLLTRGANSNPINTIAKNTEETVKAIKKVEQAITDSDRPSDAYRKMMEVEFVL